MSDVMEETAAGLGAASGIEPSPNPRRRPARYHHPGDLVRLLVSAVILGGLTVAAAGGALSRPERNVFRLVNQLPDWIDGPVRVVTQFGWVGAVGILAAVALVARRPRLAADVTIAGVMAWVLAKVVKDLAHRGRPGVLLEDVVLRGVSDAGHGFVSGHAAVAAAMATVIGAQTTRATRRLLWALAWAVAAARVYSGAHLPLDVLGGIALGWGLGALVQLVGGTPGHPVPVEAVGAALRRLGLSDVTVRPLRADARGSVPFVGETAQGELFVKTIGRDQRDADLLYRLGRWLAFREVGDETPLATAKQQVEHEAYLLLSANRAGVRVPEVIGTGEAADGSWFLAERRIRAHDLTTPGALDDAVLDDLWHQVRLLHRARIAHRDLRLANVMVGDGGVWLVDFGFAQTGATDSQLARDTAELLVSTAVAIGPARAVTAALEAVGPAELRSAAAFVQPLALSAATRRSLHDHPGSLEQLRGELAAVGAAERPTPQLRVRPAMLVAIAAAGYATHHVLVAAGGGASVAALVADLRWRWIAVGAVLAFVPFFFAARELVIAAGRPLASGRTIAAQLAAFYAGRASVLGRGSMAVRSAYLRACGFSDDDAEDAVRLTRTVGAVVHVGAAVAAALLAAFTRLRAVEPPRAASLLFVALAIAVAASFVSWQPAARRAMGRATVGPEDALRRMRADPPRARRLVTAHLGLLLTLVLGLFTAMRATSAEAPIAGTIALYLIVAGIGVAGPLAGGLGVVEPALAAGLMVLGVAPAVSVTAVIVFRLLTYWLPLAPGAVAYHRLRDRRCC